MTRGQLRRCSMRRDSALASALARAGTAMTLRMTAMPKQQAATSATRSPLPPPIPGGHPIAGCGRRARGSSLRTRRAGWGLRADRRPSVRASAADHPRGLPLHQKVLRDLLGEAASVGGGPVPAAEGPPHAGREQRFLGAEQPVDAGDVETGVRSHLPQAHLIIALLREAPHRRRQSRFPRQIASLCCRAMFQHWIPPSQNPP